MSIPTSRAQAGYSSTVALRQYVRKCAQYFRPQQQRLRRDSQAVGIGNPCMTAWRDGLRFALSAPNVATTGCFAGLINTRMNSTNRYWSLSIGEATVRFGAFRGRLALDPQTGHGIFQAPASIDRWLTQRGTNYAMSLMIPDAWPHPQRRRHGPQARAR